MGFEILDHLDVVRDTYFNDKKRLDREEPMIYDTICTHSTMYGLLLNKPVKVEMPRCLHLGART